MSATPPPGYTPPPADLPQRGDRATFSNRVDAWVTWFSTVILTQLAAMIANAYANALDAFASATAAMGYRDTALTYRDAAQAARDTALTYRDAAQAARDAAIAARDAAQNYAAALTATSTTSLVIGVGAKVFTTQAGKQFTANQTLKAINPGNAAQWMVGTAAYSGTTLTLTVTDVNPATSGNTVANWVIGLSGEKGATGATGGVTGGNLTGALNEKQGASVAVSATPDIWSGAGNSLTLTGTGTITGFTAPPQAGARRTLLVSGATVLQTGAGMNVYGGTQTVVAGDQVDVVSLDGAFWVTIRKRDGTAATGSALRYVEITSSGTWTVLAANFTVELWGGGPGGGAGVSAGAGAPGYCKKSFTGVTVGSSATVVIGAAGAGASSNTTTDTAGALGGAATASTFALSGFTTLTANPGLRPLTVSATIPGAGGTASGGDINITGSYGAHRIPTIESGGADWYGLDGGSTYMSNGGCAPYFTDALQGSGFGAPGGSGAFKKTGGVNIVGRYAGAAGQGGGCRIWY